MIISKFPRYISARFLCVIIFSTVLFACGEAPEFSGSETGNPGTGGAGDEQPDGEKPDGDQGGDGDTDTGGNNGSSGDDGNTDTGSEGEDGQRILYNGEAFPFIAASEWDGNNSALVESNQSPFNGDGHLSATINMNNFWGAVAYSPSNWNAENWTAYSHLNLYAKSDQALTFKVRLYDNDDQSGKIANIELDTDYSFHQVPLSVLGENVNLNEITAIVFLRSEAGISSNVIDIDQISLSSEPGSGDDENNDSGNDGNDGSGDNSNNIAPIMPSNFTASADSPSSIVLNWLDDSDNESAFVVERRSGPQAWMPLVSLNPNTTMYRDAGLTASTAYQYRLHARNEHGTSQTIQASGTTPSDNPPTCEEEDKQFFESQMLPILEDDCMACHFNEGLAKETEFILVPGGTAEINFAVVEEISQKRLGDDPVLLLKPTATVAHGGGKRFENESSEYNIFQSMISRIEAGDDCGNQMDVPLAPSEFLAQAIAYDQVRLTWQDNSNNENEFYIERSFDNGLSWVALTPVLENITTVIDSDLNDQSTYLYRILARNQVGSSPSVVATVMTPAAGGLDCGENKATIPTRVWRLTNEEYNSVVSELLSWNDNYAEGFVAEPKIHHLPNNADRLQISDFEANSYASVAEEIADLADMDSLLSCNTADRPCAEMFIREFARRAFRRPLDNPEIQGLLNVYDVGAQDGFEEGVRLVLSAILQSPSFLYRTEIGEGNNVEGDQVIMTQYEIASAISFTISGTLPDAALLAAADNGELGDANIRETHAKRLLNIMASDEGARVHWQSFFGFWLGIDELIDLPKDSDTFPNDSASLRQAMLRETEEFVGDALAQDPMNINTMFTADYTFVNRELAQFYGSGTDANITSVPLDSFVRVNLNENQRKGLLTHASVLATHANPDRNAPVKRGKLVREQLLCQTLSAPPADVPPLSEGGEAQSLRKRLEEHRKNPECAACHELTDPIGFGFSNFNAMGFHELVRYGDTIDASGEFIKTLDIDGEFNGAIEMVNRLSNSDEVSQCFVKNFYRYARGRTETDSDSCELQNLTDTFKASGTDFKSLMLNYIRSDMFIIRRVD